MELAYRLSAIKGAVRGKAARNETDRRQINRYMRIDAAAPAVLHPLALPRPSCDLLSYDRITVLAGG
jgi:hypothetical protein